MSLALMQCQTLGNSDCIVCCRSGMDIITCGGPQFLPVSVCLGVMRFQGTTHQDYLFFLLLLMFYLLEAH